MSTKTGWKRTTQVKLIAELQGFWATDLWDMHHSPVKDLSPLCKATPLALPVQVVSSERRAEISMLEEVLGWALA
jgi:hypothetical protein